MKRFILLATIFFTVVAHAEVLTKSEQQTLQQLNCQQKGFKFISHHLVFDEKTGAKKRLFLIKNINQQQIYIDFPQGHIGASAGLTQAIDPNYWLGYVYVQDKDQIHTEDKQGHIIYQHPHWTCIVTGDQSSRCEKFLYVCEVKNTKQKQLDNIFQRSERANWSAQAQASIMDILNHWFN